MGQNFCGLFINRCYSWQVEALFASAQDASLLGVKALYADRQLTIATRQSAQCLIADSSQVT
jgi:hypothetical protein